MGEELTSPLKQVATVLEMIEIERFLPDGRGVGRPAKDRVALARAFVAKATADDGSADRSPQGRSTAAAFVWFLLATSDTGQASLLAGLYRVYRRPTG